MAVPQSPIDWLQLLSLGAFAGAMGQSARVIVGLKKISDAAASTNAAVSDLIEPSRLLISMVIGAIAGALAATQLASSVLDVSNILALAAAGYAGADFIEGFMRRVSADPSAPVGSDTKGSASGASSTDQTGTVSDDAVG